MFFVNVLKTKSHKFERNETFFKKHDMHIYSDQEGTPNKDGDTHSDFIISDCQLVIKVVGSHP